VTTEADNRGGAAPGAGRKVYPVVREAGTAAAPERLRTRVLVIGSGVAGLHTAWRAARTGNVVLLTKRSLFDSATAYAQGGIAAAIGAGDSPELHRRDTLAAGGAICNRAAVDVLVTEGPDRVRDLLAAGAHFDIDQSGQLTLGREAAHSARRIVHARGDQTGAEIVSTLVERVRDEPRITVLEATRALELLIEDGTCVGARASRNGEPIEIIADATVLATGGCGQVYRYTTNPVVSTGDGLALAYRAGAALVDMEFVQFHPTALDTPETPLVLISEAVRGEGAVLIDDSGDRFMLRRHPLAELAPRDLVAREVFQRQQEGRRVWLDATRLRADFEHRFPGIFRLCRARGIDPRSEPIPITPAAHYLMGGIRTDLAGRTSIDRLFACGEVANTGVHGANRLASNSLLEGLVFAERVARTIASLPPLGRVAPAEPWMVPPPLDPELAARAADAVRATMWEHAGLARSAAGLRRCLAALRALAAAIPDETSEVANLVRAGRLIARAALLRDESRGGHYRTDHPRPRRSWNGRHIRLRARMHRAASHPEPV
jgi:L-aspartate oxidase